MDSGQVSQKHAILAVIFDLDGVLIDTERLAFQAWQQWAAHHGGSLPETDFPGLTGLTAEESAVYVMERTGLTFNAAESSAWAWQRVLEWMSTGSTPLSGSMDLVAGLAARGYPLAIASNSETAHVEDVLSGLGMLQFFPVRVGIDQVALGKPAPDVYRLAAQRLAIAPRRCLAVEDSRVGVQSALAAGMRVIAVPGALDNQDGFPGAWRVYPSLVQVFEDLDRILLVG